jgi:hypothetical protein
MLSNLIITLPLVLAGMIARGMETPSGPPSAGAERRTIEDAAIDSTPDPIERVDQRLDAATVAFREDLSARARTRLLWTPLDPTLVTNANAVLTRIHTLIDDSLADLLLSVGPGRDRRLARAAAIEAAAKILDVRLRRLTIKESTAAVRRIHQELDDAVERTNALDGPILLVLAMAAATADEDLPARSASTLLGRAAAGPRGIDAIEFELMQRLDAAGGVDPDRRSAIAGAMIKEPRRPADRLLIAAILLESRLQSDGSTFQAGQRTLLDALAARDTDTADRPRLTRGLATIAADTVDPSAAIESISPLASLGLSIRGSRAGDAEAALRFAIRACETGNADIGAEAQLERANLLLRSGDRGGAIDALVLLCREAPSHPSAARGAAIAARLATSESSDADHARVVNQLAEFMPSHPDRDGWMITVGDRAARNGDEETARSVWSSIDDHSELGPKALVRLIGLQDSGLDATTMLRRLDALDDDISRDSSDPLRIDSDLARMQLLLQLDRDSSAAEIAARWADLEGVPSESRLDVATLCITVFQRSGHDAEAAAVFSTLQRIDPPLARRLAAAERKAVVSNVIAAIDGDDRATAARIARRMISITPGAKVGSDWIDTEDPATLMEWSWLFAAANRSEDASALLRRILSDRPDAADALMLQAFLQGGRLSTPPDSPRTRGEPEYAEAALRTLSRITAGTSRDTRMWWRCEIERLEILYLLERSLDRIGPRIDRLRAERGDLGSEALRRRFDRLRARLSESNP